MTAKKGPIEKPLASGDSKPKPSSLNETELKSITIDDFENIVKKQRDGVSKMFDSVRSSLEAYLLVVTKVAVTGDGKPTSTKKWSDAYGHFLEETALLSSVTQRSYTDLLKLFLHCLKDTKHHATENGQLVAHNSPNEAMNQLVEDNDELEREKRKLLDHIEQTHHDLTDLESKHLHLSVAARDALVAMNSAWSQRKLLHQLVGMLGKQITTEHNIEFGMEHELVATRKEVEDLKKELHNTQESAKEVKSTEKHLDEMALNLKLSEDRNQELQRKLIVQGNKEEQGLIQRFGQLALDDRVKLHVRNIESANKLALSLEVRKTTTAQRELKLQLERFVSIQHRQRADEKRILHLEASNEGLRTRVNQLGQEMTLVVDKVIEHVDVIDREFMKMSYDAKDAAKKVTTRLTSGRSFAEVLNEVTDKMLTEPGSKKRLEESIEEMRKLQGLYRKEYTGAGNHQGQVGGQGSPMNGAFTSETRGDTKGGDYHESLSQAESIMAAFQRSSLTYDEPSDAPSKTPSEW